MIKKYIYYLIGITFLALGVALTLVSDLGAGGWDALTENLYKLTGISIGTWVIIVAITLLTISAILRKELINYKVFINSLILGKLIDFFYFTLEPLRNFDNLIIRVILLTSGLLVLGSGCAIVFVTKLPKNHTEEFVFSVVKVTKIPYQKTKTILDVLALIIAVLIGVKLQDFSNLGLGTILNSFFMGTIIHYCMPTAIKCMEKISK